MADLAITIDTSPELGAVLDEALSLLAEPSDGTAQFIERLRLLSESGRLIETDGGPAGSTDKAIVRLNPTREFLALVAALRASKSEGGIGEGHVEGSVVDGVATSTIEKRAAGVDSAARLSGGC